MDRMKTLLIYLLILIGIFVLSDFLINVGLNSSYKDIERKDNNSQITVYQAQATYVNGRIRGIIENTDGNIKDKYLKVELYSPRDVFLGKTYLEIQDLEKGETQPFELFFKAEGVQSYKMEIVQEKEGGAELEILPEEWSKPQIIVATMLTLLILW